ncbi:MAG TPA: sensor histidine kinase [Bacillota bacterium]|nr:sensor histidine kinase [Bacillota bacterium]
MRQVLMNDFSLHILDLAENSLNAGADDIIITLVTKGDRKILVIVDNGHGLRGIEPHEALSPFYTTRTTRRVGFGLGLLEQLTRLCQGWVKIVPAKPHGLVVVSVFAAGHWDLPPDGDMASSVITLLLANPQCRFRINYGDNPIHIDSKDLADLDYSEKIRRLQQAFAAAKAN